MAHAPPRHPPVFCHLRCIAEERALTLAPQMAESAALAPPPDAARDSSALRFLSRFWRTLTEKSPELLHEERAVVVETGGRRDPVQGLAVLLLVLLHRLNPLAC